MLKKFEIAVICFLFLGGLIFGGQSLVPKEAQAQITVSPSFCTNCPGGFMPCVTVGFPQITTAAIERAFRQVLQQFLDSFTSFFDNIFNNFIGNLLNGINDIIEGMMITWQNDFFSYELMPALQLATGQINTAYIDSWRAVNSGMDGMNNARRLRAGEDLQASAFATAKPSPQICVAGSIGGSNWAASYAKIRAFMRASETMFTHRGAQKDPQLADNSNQDMTVTAQNLMNGRFTPGLDIGNENSFEGSVTQAQVFPRSSTGPGGHQGDQWQRYCTYLAQPTDNGDRNGCGNVTVTPGAQGMDIKPMEFLYNSYLIDVTQEPIEHALNAVKENLVDLSPPPLIPGSSLGTGPGRQQMIDQRSYLARKNAARSVVEFVSSSRLPTARASDLVHQLRGQAGAPLTDIIDGKTSYKEIMNALSNEIFATGTYNLDREECINTTENPDAKITCIKRESLILSALYLMQLRDYYELLERGVLTLAVQTSIEIGAESSGSEGGSQ